VITDAIFGIFMGIVEAIVGLLPAASTIPAIPEVLLDGVGFVASLDRYVPVHEWVQVAGLALVIQNAAFVLWVAGWVYARLPVKAT